MKNTDSIEIIGGGTISHVRNHLALTAPAYGNTARKLYMLLREKYNLSAVECDLREYGYSRKRAPIINLHLTKMASAGESQLETNQDIEKLIDQLVANPNTKMIFMNAALVDYDACVTTEGACGYDWDYNIPTRSGKYQTRLRTSEGRQKLLLTPAAKIIGKIRKERKDIFLVGFKTTCGATEDEQFLSGLHLLKSTGCNLVLANDTKFRINMIITPEQARYCVTDDRKLALTELVKMASARAESTFTRSTVVEGQPVAWNAEEIPQSLRTVVDYCIAKGAYKPFNGATVGHFAVKLNDKTFLTSRRKTDFNNLNDVGLVKVESDGPDSVIAYGSKPSVGGQSQRIVFANHPDADCIVHFHCPLRETVQGKFSTRPQKLLECGSHECGKNTSDGLREEAPGIKAVYLDNHGPNIVFNSKINPQKVIDFIDDHFNLSKSTDGVSQSITRSYKL
jgi:hypothetical protein